MKQYIKVDEWKIVEDGFQPQYNRITESLCSIGNGKLGQRGMFEEKYSGDTLQGSYIAGIYFPDKTRVGWWKNGYPEYFAKVINSVNWIGLQVHINGFELDLHACSVRSFVRELNMLEGTLYRSFIAKLPTGEKIKVETKRFLSIVDDEIGALEYSITALNFSGEIVLVPFLDFDVVNEDSNYEEKFWSEVEKHVSNGEASIVAKTKKLDFYVGASMKYKIFKNDQLLEIPSLPSERKKYVANIANLPITEGESIKIEKYVGIVSSQDYDNTDVLAKSLSAANRAFQLGFQDLAIQQSDAWAEKWKDIDIKIEGDSAAQQGIRFNIFQLHQTYTGKDARLNIGPKGFTGEKYGGSTYWDTEAYCLPFYMSTAEQNVSKNLLIYRYNHLPKAIENAKKLGFKNGAALYPMVTMNGEECHNEWEITFEEIHRNGAIAFAIFNYHRFTGDYSYIPEKGLEVLIGIARFWHQRATYSTDRNQFVILGVTGPNEYENNVNNNFYTNYIAKWCIDYTIKQIHKIEKEYSSDYTRILDKAKLSLSEINQWKEVADKMYFPYSEEHGVYLQQDGFLDKELVKVSDLDKSQRPINQKWSWDRILRSPYIKQADTLQGFYFFEDHFSKEQLEKHFDFYEPFTVHESSLSPCVHSIQAAVLDRMEQAYTFYLRTSRLDLDDYNKEVHEGLHITSMAGTWMSIVEGFGGMRVKDNQLHFEPKIPNQWKGYSFKINFRNQILKVDVRPNETKLSLEGDKEIIVFVNGKQIIVEPNSLVTV